MNNDDIRFHSTFTPDRAAKMAFARRPIVARAVRSDMLTPSHGPVFLWGEPLIGKTTLVRQVLWSLEPDQYLVTRLPIGALAETLPGSNRFAGVLADQVRVQMEVGAIEPHHIAIAKTFAKALIQCQAVAESTNRMLVMAIEGVERYSDGVWPNAVQENLAHVCSLMPSVSLLLTSRLPLWRLESVKLPDKLRVHFVPPLDYKEARRLLTAPARGLFEYGHESLQKLLSVAGGRPFLLQIIGRNCQRIMQALGQTCVTSKETHEIRQSCWPAGEHLFRPVLGYLRPAAQKTLAAVAWGTSLERPVATLSQAYESATALGFRGSIDDLGYELGRLRVWRLLSSTAANGFYLTAGWFADYIRAGRR